MPLPVTFATLGAGNQPLSLFDTQFGAVASLGYVPCAAGAGPNNITLTPFASTPNISSYPDLAPGFVFVAGATSTGAVTLNVNLVGSRNAYKWNASAPAGAGDIVSGGIYRAVPLQALNAGAGGFAIDSVGVSLPSVDAEFIIDGGGNPITTGVKGFVRLPWAANLASWIVMADQSGSISVDVLRANNAVPSASMVGAGNKPGLTASQFSGVVTPSGWTSTAFAANDWIGFNVISAATVTRVTVDLNLSKI